MTQDQIVLENLVELINEHDGIESFSQACGDRKVG